MIDIRQAIGSINFACESLTKPAHGLRAVDADVIERSSRRELASKSQPACERSTAEVYDDEWLVWPAITEDLAESFGELFDMPLLVPVGVKQASVFGG